METRDYQSLHASGETGGARVWEVFHSARARPWDIGEWNSEEVCRAGIEV